MKKLIFASYGFRSPAVCDKLIRIIPEPEAATVLIIPFAGLDPVMTGEREKAAAVDFGFRQENVTVLREGDPFPDAADFICVPGGDTFKLMHTIRKAGIAGDIVRAVMSGSVYIGHSAGACIASPDIGYVRLLEDDNYGGDTAGLGLVPEHIICHFSPQRYGVCGKCRETGLTVVTLTDTQIAVVTDGEWSFPD